MGVGLRGIVSAALMALAAGLLGGCGGDDNLSEADATAKSTRSAGSPRAAPSRSTWTRRARAGRSSWPPTRRSCARTAACRPTSRSSSWAARASRLPTTSPPTPTPWRRRAGRWTRSRAPSRVRRRRSATRSRGRRMQTKRLSRRPRRRASTTAGPHAGDRGRDLAGRDGNEAAGRRKHRHSGQRLRRHVGGGRHRDRPRQEPDLQLSRLHADRPQAEGRRRQRRRSL